MTIPLYQIDAFSARPFAGNPAAVCLLPGPPGDRWMQAMAAEMNLSETAFVWRDDARWRLRWFTPTIEVELCGHATLAAAAALWTEGWLAADQDAEFQTQSGRLQASLRESTIELDFPATPPTVAEAPAGLVDSLGVTPVWMGRCRFDLLVLVKDESTVRSLRPDFVRLGAVDARGVMVTSRSDTPDFDFVSRFFAPASGINEDPVTGSAHCGLAPFWGTRLGKEELIGYQASPRGGVVRMALRGDRVILRGETVIVFRGELSGHVMAVLPGEEG